MIVRVLIERVPEEGEDEKELEVLEFGAGQTGAVFDYDPKSKDYWKYLLDLQESMFNLFRHEITKAQKYLAENEPEKEKEKDNNE